MSRIRTYKKGRRCAHPGCNTILSIYNNDKFCALHYHKSFRGTGYKWYQRPAELDYRVINGKSFFTGDSK